MTFGLNIKTLLAAILTLLLSSPAHSVEIDSRYCGIVERTTSGEIKRSSTVIRQFRARWACPSTGYYFGACPGWQIDHVIPLATGGCDSIINLQWLPVQIKTGKDETWSKDRWELEVYSPYRLLGEPIEFINKVQQ